VTEPSHEDHPGVDAGPWARRAVPVGVALGVAVVAALALSIGPRPAVPRAEVVLGVLALGVLCRFGGGPDGAGTADLMLRASGVTDRAGVRRRVAEAGWSLAVYASGVAVASGVAALWLALYGGSGDRILAFTAGVGLLIRARLFTGWAGRLLTGSGAVAVAVAVVRLAAAPPAVSGWLVVATGAVVAGIAFVAMAALDRDAGSGRERLLVWAEPMAVTTMICAAAVAVVLPDTAAR
jgi:hypothetical protein